MSLLSKLFGGGSSGAAAEPELYKGFNIFPEPVKEPGGYRVTARIEREVDGELRTHTMIRADTYSAADTATEATIAKAQILIDQQGDAIFD